MPLGIGNLQKGKRYFINPKLLVMARTDTSHRYSNMDYIVVLVIYMLILYFGPITRIIISYDIACQWFVNLFRRMEHWPTHLRIPASTQLIHAIPKLHEPMHGRKNHQQFSLNFIPGVGKSDMEMPEHVWVGHNGLGNSTKTQGPGGHHDILDDHFGFWNWLKYIGIGKTLMLRYKAALAERNRQVEGHCGLMSSLDGLVGKWEAMCVAWEDDAYPKKCENPYKNEGICEVAFSSLGHQLIYSFIEMTEAEVRKEFAEEDEERLSAGEEYLHDMSALGFVILGLELEDFQCVFFFHFCQSFVNSMFYYSDVASGDRQKIHLQARLLDNQPI